MQIQLSHGVTIVDEKKFVEVHTIRSEIGGEVNKPFKERLELYYQIKLNQQWQTK